MRKELCRNFQRGSCRFGEGCRFLHPQQLKPNNNNNNPFGFGSQQQQQQQQQQQKSPNPFGFGVQGGSGSNRPNQFQPFENKWQRTPSTTPGGGGASSSTQQSGKQTQQADHKCTDPAACKRVIQDDFKNERPMWKLTCYAHWKHFPCDVTGDISYEELRAMAYEEAKRGIPLQSIVERERSLQNSKIAEFDNFQRNPYKGGSSVINTANQSPFASTTPSSIFPQANQMNPSPPFSGFNQQQQQPAFPNTNSSGVSQPPDPFAFFNKQPNAFSANTPQPIPSGPSAFQSQPSASFPGFSNAVPQRNNMFPSVTPTPALDASQNNQTAFDFNNPVSSFTTPVVDTTNTSPGTELKIGQGASVDSSIWLKEKWMPGEIPEQAPPDAFV